jgi:5-methylcytosine-specific restriction endonuclease McrA
MCTGRVAERMTSWEVGHKIVITETPEGIRTMIHDGPSSSGLRRRFAVLKRDNYRCQLCGATVLDGSKLEVDHKHPKSRGGPATMENLWTLCYSCNRGKKADSL